MSARIVVVNSEAPRLLCIALIDAVAPTRIAIPRLELYRLINEINSRRSSLWNVRVNERCISMDENRDAEERDDTW
jgi:hypothetical protein